MSYTARYDKGDWKALCDVCGRLFKASTLQKRWDGLMCCSEDWEIRQPQDFVKGQADHQTAPWIRDEPNDTFVVLNFTPPAVLIPATSTSTLSFTYIAYNPKDKTLNALPINDTTLG